MSNLSFTCPFCPTPDPTRNLSVQQETGLYHCFRCGAKPSTHGVLPLDLNILSPKVILRPLVPEPTDIHDPMGCDFCLDFLWSRDITWLRTPSWLSGGQYHGHRLFFTDPVTSYWQGRATSTRNHKTYLGRPGPGLNDEAPVLDMNTFDRRYDPVIVEGPTDGLRLWTLGIHAICLFGKTFYLNKLNRLQSVLFQAARVMVCLDRDDCEMETNQWVWGLSKFIQVTAWPIEAADPGCMSRQEAAKLRKETQR